MWCSQLHTGLSLHTYIFYVSQNATNRTVHPSWKRKTKNPASYVGLTGNESKSTHSQMLYDFHRTQSANMPLFHHVKSQTEKKYLEHPEGPAMHFYKEPWGGR